MRWVLARRHSSLCLLMVVGARRSQGRLEDEWMRGWRVRVRENCLVMVMGRGREDLRYHPRTKHVLCQKQKSSNFRRQAPYHTYLPS